MVEQNPLQDLRITPTLSCISSSSSDEVTHSNKKGRPRKVNVVKFGPQPQSMVARFLKLNKTKADSDPDVCATDQHYNRPSPILEPNLIEVQQDQT